MCYYASKAEMGCKRAEDLCQTPEGGMRPKAPRERLLSRMHPATRDAQQMVPWQKMLPSCGTLGPARARRAAAPPRHAAPHCCSPARVPGAPAAPRETPWWQSPRCWGIRCCSKSLQRSYQGLYFRFFVKAEKQRFRENSISSEPATHPHPSTDAVRIACSDSKDDFVVHRQDKKNTQLVYEACSCYCST